MKSAKMDEVNVSVSVGADVNDPQENLDTESNIPPQEGDDVLDEVIDGDNEIEAVEEENEAREELRTSLKQLNLYLKKHDEVSEMIQDLKEVHLGTGWINKWNSDGVLTRTGLLMIPAVESFDATSNSDKLEAQVLAGLEGLGSSIWSGIGTLITKIVNAWKRMWEGFKLRWFTIQENIDRLRKRFDENRPDIEELANYTIRVLPTQSILDALADVDTVNFTDMCEDIRSITTSDSSGINDITKKVSESTRDIAAHNRSLVLKLRISKPLALSEIAREDVLTILDKAEESLRHFEVLDALLTEIFEEYIEWSNAMTQKVETTSITTTATLDGDLTTSETTVSTDVTPGQVKNTIRIVSNAVDNMLALLHTCVDALFESTRTASARIVQGTK